jgi:chemotaxis protein CheD
MTAPAAARLGIQPATSTGVLHVLNPGDVAIGTRDDRLETLLGSCIAVVLTDPRRTVGAMCHIVHGRQAPAGERQNAAFADVALERMFALIRARGITPGLCEAYVYGGGNMFPQLFRDTHIGECNASWALQALATAGIRVLARDTGGPVYRRIAWTVGPVPPTVCAVGV